MQKISILLADGFEEVEALTPADVLNRAGFDVQLVSVNNELLVTGAHRITVKCDLLIEQIVADEAIMLILPGGMPGTNNLMASENVKRIIRDFYNKEKWIAAICAAPMILGEMDLLKGKTATCYPGYEKHLIGANVVEIPAVTDGKFITGRGIGTAMAFSLEIVKNLIDQKTADELARKMVV
jgi:4-methyl-5(b-hydroxyethyl)-thiazole monophosphate biosynthesis